jgi:glycosyltransferase involved in cell wall biosynthesis
LHAFWKGKVICTFSTAIYTKHIRVFAAIRRRNVILCGISNNHWQGQPYPELWRTVYNGIDMSLYPGPSVEAAGKRKHLLYLGKISSIKGVHIAIDVAERSGTPIILAGNISPEEGGPEYFESLVRPRLNQRVQWVGEVNDQQKVTLFEGARALLFPIQQEEPFGLVMTEAMASGVPVIALRRGSVPEVVVDGKTGFICDTTDQMVAAVERSGEISPAFCRWHVERHFSEDRMVQAYLSLYGCTAARHASPAEVAAA